MAQVGYDVEIIFILSPHVSKNAHNADNNNIILIECNVLRKCKAFYIIN